MKNSNNQWGIEHQCPQCGAPVILDETDRIFSCGFCRVRLYITSETSFRYYLPPKITPLKNVIFIPYWRFKGAGYFCKPYDVSHRYIDTTIIAAGYQSLPYSIGYRPQAMKLRFIDPSMESSFVKPAISIEDVISRLDTPVNLPGMPSVPERLFYKAFIGETLSLVYSPFFKNGNVMYDAVINSVVGKVDGNTFNENAIIENHQTWKAGFIPILCPDCGWDLSGESDSRVLFCKNCDSAWNAGTNEFNKVNFGVIPGRDDNLYYLPFWRLKADISGLPLKSYADLIKAANLPKAIMEGWDKREIYFWSPAFKVPPELFLRLTRQMTISQPSDEIGNTLSDKQFCAVNLPAKEAAESIIITIANFTVNRKDVYPMLKEIKTNILEELLIFSPFKTSGNEFIHPSLKFSIYKTAITKNRNAH